MKKITTLLFAIILLCGTVQAQDPYKHSVGVMGGFSPAPIDPIALGITYKGFFVPHFGFQAELFYSGWSNDIFELSIAVNGMYQNNIISGLSWFAGGGLSGGIGYYYSSSRKSALYGSINAIAGFEYTFNFPMSIQLDARPEFVVYNEGTYFSASAILSIRYVIK